MQVQTDQDSEFDPLTGMMRRSRFVEAVGVILQKQQGGADRPVLLAIDLDRFKAVNDSAGLETGDAVLKRVASRIKGAAGQDAVLGRISGDEFAILLPNPLDAVTTGQKLLELVARPYAVNGHAIKITASIGVARWPEDGTDVEALIRSANIALHHAEIEGRNRQRAFEPSMLELSRLRMALENDLRAALGLQQMELRAAVQLEQFTLRYHPRILLSTGRLHGFDAVLNWVHPGRGLLGPDGFFRLAEEIGLVNLLGNWALQRACAAAATWPCEPGGHSVLVCVDISPLQLREGRVFVQLIAETLAKTGLAPNRLKLQLAEGAVSDAAEAVLREIRALGVRIALKDFGVGSASLRMLARVQFDQIQIDRSITEAAGRDGEPLPGAPPRSASAWMTRAVSALGLGLGITTLADGVTTRQEFENMRGAGLTAGQGAFFGAPLHDTEVPAAIVALRDLTTLLEQEA